MQRVTTSIVPAASGFYAAPASFIEGHLSDVNEAWFVPVTAWAVEVLFDEDGFVDHANSAPITMGDPICGEAYVIDPRGVVASDVDGTWPTLAALLDALRARVERGETV